MSRAPLLFTTLLFLTAACTPQTDVNKYTYPTNLQLKLTQPGQQCNIKDIEIDTGPIQCAGAAACYLFPQKYLAPNNTLSPTLTEERPLETVNINTDSFLRIINDLESWGLTYEQIMFNLKLVQHHEMQVHPCELRGLEITSDSEIVAGVMDLQMLLRDKDYAGSNEVTLIGEGLTQLTSAMAVLSEKRLYKDFDVNDIQLVKRYLNENENYNVLGIYTSNVLFLLEAYSEEELIRMIDIYNVENEGDRYNTDKINEIWSILLYGFDLNQPIPDYLLSELRVEYGNLGYLQDRLNKLSKGEFISIADVYAEFAIQVKTAGDNRYWQDWEGMSYTKRAQKQRAEINYIVSRFKQLMKQLTDYLKIPELGSK